ncbi:MAG: hypothetical protein ABIH34_02615 [Nanoarchaeota archaeon]
MASVLDLGLLGYFKPILSIVLVAALAYGMFSYTKIFGENKSIYAVISVLIALTLAFIPALNNLVSTMLPWFVVFFIFVIFILMGYKLFGATDSDLSNVLKGNKTIVYWVLVIGILIFLGSIGQVFFTATDGGDTTDITNTSRIQTGDVGSTGSGAFWATIVHPKVLGMIVILLIGVFTIMTLAGGSNN